MENLNNIISTLDLVNIYRASTNICGIHNLLKQIWNIFLNDHMKGLQANLNTFQKITFRQNMFYARNK